MRAEMRTRLLAGLKRYFVSKRLAGLLSADALRILEFACDNAVEEADHPLRLWAELEKEISGGFITRGISRVLLASTQLYRTVPLPVQGLMSWPFRLWAGVLRGYLGRKMLVACEVAVECCLALGSAPHVQWLKSQGTEVCWRLVEEVESEREAAHRFIIQRVIEAPNRFAAIQSYRVAAAMLRQQLLFVGELFEAGMLSKSESQDLADPIDRRLRHLEILGPVWRPPRPNAVLRSLPFMAQLPPAAFKLVWELGSLSELASGECLWTSAAHELSALDQRGGFYIVLGGVVRRVHIRPDGRRAEYFHGAGGVVGLLNALTGSKLPGSELALAEGNMMGKGPVVLHVPQTVVAKLTMGAAVGDAAMVRLEEELLRLSALYVVDSLADDVAAAVAAQLTEAALGTTTVPGEGSAVVSSRKSSLKEPVARSRSASGVMSKPRSSFVGALPAWPQPQDQVQTGGNAAALHAPGNGLLSSKSVGVNFAAMMQQIAELEFEDDSEESENMKDDPPAPTSPRRAGPRGSLNGGATPSLESGPSDLSTSGLQPTSAPAARIPTPLLSSPAPGPAPGPASPQEKDPSAPPTAAINPQMIGDLMADVRRSLYEAVPVRLSPGACYEACGHVVLLAGLLRSSHAAAFLKSALAVDKEIAAPNVLPWLPLVEQFGSKTAAVGGAMTPQTWEAGGLGALIMVAHNADNAT